MIIQIGEKQINLDIGEELKVKDFRKIQPILTNYKQGLEVEMIIEIVKALSSENVEDMLNDMNIQEFTLLSQEVSKILEKKTIQSKDTVKK